MGQPQSPGSLKILQVCTSASWGGMEMHVGVLSEQLAREQGEISVICAPGSRLHQFLQEKHILLWQMQEGGYVRPFALFRAIQIMQTFKPDVIHLHYSKDLWWLVPALQFFPHIAVLLSKHVGTQKPKKDLLHRHLYSRVQYIIAISNIIQENVIQTHPVAPARVVVVHQGVDLKKFDLKKINRNQVRESLGFRTNHIVLGIIGRLQKAKGYLEFLQMASRLQNQFPECRYLLVGEASRGEEAEAQEILLHIHELGLQRIVKWVGYRTDIPEILAALDIFVFPSHAEAFGLVLIEAMAMARPIISSNCDGVLDIVEDQKTGILIAPKQVDRLVRAASTLIKDNKLRQRMGRAGRKRVEQLFDNQRMIKNIQDLYLKAYQERNTRRKA